MSLFNDVCDWFEANVSHAEPWAVALKLGVLHSSHIKTEHERKCLDNALKQLEDSFDASKYKALWDAFEKYKNDHTIIEPATVGLMQNALFYLLTNPKAFNQLNNAHIVALGHQYPLYRVTMLALIRKHNPTTDPFINFPFGSLKVTSAEQTQQTVGSLIKQLPKLPLNELESLGAQPQIAELILKDCYSHEQYFDLSANYARKHPLMRTSIARAWENYFLHYPLTAYQLQFLQSQMPQMKKFPEFATLNMESRLVRVHERPKPEEDFLSILMGRAGHLLGSLVEHNLAVSQDYVNLMNRAKSLVVGYSHTMKDAAEESLSLNSKILHPKPY